MEQEKKNWFLSLSCSPLVIWKGRVVTTRQEQLGMVETQPSTENVSSKTGEGNTSCFQMLSLRQFFTQQKAAGSNLSLADILCRAKDVVAHPFWPDSLWPLLWTPSTGVKESVESAWTERQRAPQSLCHILKVKQLATNNRAENK